VASIRNFDPSYRLYEYCYEFEIYTFIVINGVFLLRIPDRL